jgi:hypothetical protein
MRALPFLLAAATAVAAFAACNGDYYTSSTFAYTQPPPPRDELVSYRPGYVYVHGHWLREPGGWRFEPGYYMPEKPGLMWVDGHWAQQNGQYVWIDGGWYRRGATTIVRREVGENSTL